MRTNVAACPQRVSWDVQATASSGAARAAAHGRAPCIAQPNARAQPGGTSSSATQVSTSALEGSSLIATITTAIDSGATSAPRPAAEAAQERGHARRRQRHAGGLRGGQDHVVGLEPQSEQDDGSCETRRPGARVPCGRVASGAVHARRLRLDAAHGARHAVRAAAARGRLHAGLVEADDDGLYVVKFRGAGQGPKALVAEIVAGEIARAAGFAVPELVLVEVDPIIAAAEPDPEIQELVQASGGLNAGLDFLPGALAVHAGRAGRRRPRARRGRRLARRAAGQRGPHASQPHMLVWHGRLWLIDHGAALYRHHAPSWPAGAATAAFPQIADHALLPFAGPIDAADARLAPLLDDAALEASAAGVPDAWLEDDAADARAAYVTHLRERLAAPRAFAVEAEEARARVQP